MAATNNTPGALEINASCTIANTDAEIGIFASSNIDGVNTSWGAESRTFRSDAAYDKDAWLAWAMRVDAGGGTVLLRALGGDATVDNPTRVAAWLGAQAGKRHMFGISRYATKAGVFEGDMGLFAIYDRALSSAEINACLAAARTRMAARGITAV